jgi:hypothetical protein
MRTVKTTSGATAVQVVWSSRRGSREIEHLGSAHDEAELEALKAAARQRMAAGQLELDLGPGSPGPSGPLPITSSRMGHLVDALERAYRGPREYRWARIPARLAAWPGLLAAGPPVPARPRRDRLLRLLRAPPGQHRRPGLGSREPLAHRGVLRPGQGRGRPGPLPGPHLARLARPHHRVDARAGLARRQPRPGGKRGTGTSDPGMIGNTLAEIRRLLTGLAQSRAPDPDTIWSWSRWRRRRQHQARQCHYQRRGYALT